MDKEKILAAAEGYRADMSAFLRAMISHPGESCEEKEVVACLQEIRDLPNLKKYGEDVKVSMYMYDRPAWTGTVYETEAYFPTWINKGRAAPSLYREEDKIADVS